MSEKTVISVRFPSDYAEEIDQICEATGKTRSDVVIEAVESYLNKAPAPRVLSELEILKEKVEAIEKKLKQSTRQRKAG